MSEKVSQKKTQWIKAAITVLAFGLIAFLLYKEWDQITLSLQSVSLGFFLLLLLITICSRLMVCLRWYFLLRGSGVNLPFRQSLEITFVGLFTSNFLPTTVGGDIIRLAAASKITNQPVQIAGSLVMDRLMGILGMVLVSPLGAYQVITQGALAARPTAAFASFPFLTKPLHWVKEKVLQLLGQTLQVLQTWRSNPRYLVFSLLSTLGHMGFLFLTITLFLKQLGSPIDYWLVAGLWSLSYFITLIPISINGLGMQELSITLLYGQIGHVDQHAALLMAVMIRVLQVLVSTPGGILFYFVFPHVFGDLQSQTEDRSV